MVGFAADAEGRPILAISTLSPHTLVSDQNKLVFSSFAASSFYTVFPFQDLQEVPKCTLLVSRDLNEQSEALVTVVGDAFPVRKNKHMETSALPALGKAVFS